VSEPKETIFEQDEHHVPSSAASVITFVVLAGLAILNIAIGFSDLGPMKVLANLFVAGLQVAVLTLFFMELRQGDKLTWLAAGAAVFWTGLMFLFILTDYLTRHLGAI
jgi:caa(3)-type oxidase subunit IV